ncbi:MAG TPA: DUF2089 domain-containing protein [Anaerolineales bacterium]|nr:DUF2089 domain-containing protein [Anaerolineales bacterium]
MHPLISQCPVCQEDLTITRLHCRNCETTIDGQFFAGPFSQLTRPQLAFIETFVRCEGKLNRMEAELSLSYPTIRNRLHEVIRALGFEPGGEEDTGLAEEERQRVLEQLSEGVITAEEAMKILQEA